MAGGPPLWASHPGLPRGIRGTLPAGRVRSQHERFSSQRHLCGEGGTILCPADRRRNRRAGGYRQSDGAVETLVGIVAELSRLWYNARREVIQDRNITAFIVRWGAEMRCPASPSKGSERYPCALLPAGHVPIWAVVKTPGTTMFSLASTTAAIARNGPLRSSQRTRARSAWARVGRHVCATGLLRGPKRGKALRPSRPPTRRQSAASPSQLSAASWRP